MAAPKIKEINTTRIVSSNDNSLTATFLHFPLKFGKEYDAFVNQLGRRPSLSETEKWLKNKNGQNMDWTTYITYPLIAIGVIVVFREWWNKRK